MGTLRSMPSSPRCVSQIAMSCSGWSYGRGRWSSVSMTLKIVLFAPIPKASESVTTVRKPGLLPRLRTPRRKSCARLATYAKGSLMSALESVNSFQQAYSESPVWVQEGLPDSLEVILIENPIVADNGNIFRQRLRDQHSVKWISVLACEPSGA